MEKYTDTRQKGRESEALAVSYIEQNGGYVLDRNFYFKGGEIDIVARDKMGNDDYLCFIEVKARKDTAMGHPLEAVTYSKQQKIIKGAKTYMNFKKYSPDTAVRFDVISILGNEVQWIKNAF